MTGDELSVRTDGEVVQAVLPAEPAATKRARQLVAASWSDLDNETLGDVELIPTELVANAFATQTEIVLRMRRAQFAIDVGVPEHGPGEPLAQPLDTTSNSGRGLAIIDQLSMQWGCDPLPDGTGKWSGRPLTRPVVNSA